MQKRVFNPNPWREISKKVPLTSEDVNELKDAANDPDQDTEGAPFKDQNKDDRRVVVPRQQGKR